MIKTIYGEGGLEPAEGQAAIAHVIMNRVRSGEWGGKTARDVALAHDKHGNYQFSAWHDRPGQMNAFNDSNPLYRKIGSVVDRAAKGNGTNIEDIEDGLPDTTGGAVLYYSPRGMNRRNAPNWSASEGVKIGNHVFYPKPGSELAKEFPKGKQVNAFDELMKDVESGKRRDSTPEEAPSDTSAFDGLLKSRGVDINTPEPAVSKSIPKTFDNASSVPTPLKLAGTAALHGVGDTIGLPRAIDEGMSWAGAHLNSLVTGKPYEQAYKDIQAQYPEWERTENLFPSSAEVTKPYFDQEGEYKPENEIERLGMGGIRGAVGGALLGPANVARNAATGAVAGLAGTTGYDASKYMGLGEDAARAISFASGLVAPTVLPTIGSLGAAAMSQDAQNTANALRDRFGIDMRASNIAGGGLSQGLDNIARFVPGGQALDRMSNNNTHVAIENAAKELGGVPANSEINSTVVQQAKRAIGNERDNLYRSGNAVITPQISNDLRNLYQHARIENGPNSAEAEAVRGAINTVVEHASNPNFAPYGEIPGRAIQGWKKPGNSLLANVPDFYANRMKDILDNAFESGTSPQTMDQIRLYNQQLRANNVLKNSLGGPNTGRLDATKFRSSLDQNLKKEPVQVQEGPLRDMDTLANAAQMVPKGRPKVLGKLDLPIGGLAPLGAAGYSGIMSPITAIPFLGGPAAATLGGGAVSLGARMSGALANNPYARRAAYGEALGTPEAAAIGLGQIPGVMTQYGYNPEDAR